MKDYKLTIRGVEIYHNPKTGTDCLRVLWIGEPGYGQLDLFTESKQTKKDETQKLYMDTECMSDEFVKQLFTAVGEWLIKNATRKD